MISCLDRSKSSCVDRLWMSECNSERALRFHDRLQIMLRKLAITKNTVGVHCGEPYSQERQVNKLSDLISRMQTEISYFGEH